MSDYLNFIQKNYHRVNNDYFKTPTEKLKALKHLYSLEPTKTLYKQIIIPKNQTGVINIYMTQTTNNTPHKITDDKRGNIQHDITIPNTPPMIPSAPPMIPSAPQMIPNAPPLSLTRETPEQKEERRIRTEIARQKKAVELTPKPVDPRELHNIALNDAIERRRKKLEGGGRFNKRLLKLL